MLGDGGNPAEFWDLYFRDRFLILERGNESYHGLALGLNSIESGGFGLFNTTGQRVIEVSFSDLRDYDYAGDARFSLLSRIPKTPGQAIAAVGAQSYPYRDPAPFGKERMAELINEFGWSGSRIDDAVSLSDLEQMTADLVDKFNPTRAQHLALLVWLLGELRQRSSAKALVKVVSNSSYVPYARHRLPFYVVDAALSALWKINNKFSLFDLLILLDDAEDSGRRKIVPLFSRLLSTDELLSLEKYGSDYFAADLWREILEPCKSFTELDWDMYDVKSLFWEIRVLAVERLPATNAASLQRLANDEVGTVADAARTRLRRG